MVCKATLERQARRERAAAKELLMEKIGSNTEASSDNTYEILDRTANIRDNVKHTMVLLGIFITLSLINIVLSCYLLAHFLPVARYIVGPV